MHISIDTLLKEYRAVRALDNLSLEIEPGQIVCVVGANGAGKTTLFRLLSTMSAPTSGTIRFDGQQLSRERVDLRRRLFFLADAPIMFEGRTVAGHIAAVLKVYGKNLPAIAATVADYLAEFDILPYVEQQVRQLSRGQRYKAAVVTMLAADCELWLIDEPFASGIDPLGQAALRKHLRAAADQGATIILTTQILELAEKVADRICVLHNGRVQAFGTTDQFTHAGEAGELETMLATLRANDGLNAQG